MKKGDETLVDAAWKKIKNNKYLSIIIVSGGIIIGISAFSGSLQNLFNFSDNFSGCRQNTDVYSSENFKTDGLINSFFDSNFQFAEKEESDIISLSKDHINIDFSIKNSDSNANIIYVLKKEKKSIKITPYNSYLAIIEKGGPITELREWDHSLSSPYFDFKIVNNSRKSVFFTKAIFSFSTSKPDSFPILFVEFYDPPELQLHIRNESCGNLYNVKVKFNIITTEQKIDFESGYENDQILRMTEEGSAVVALTDAFKKHGVRTELFKAAKYTLQPRTPEEQVYTFRYQNNKEYKFNLHSKEYEKWISDARGPFKNGIAIIYGEIIYEGKNAMGKMAKDTLKFETKYPLELPWGPEPGNLNIDNSAYYKMIPEVDKNDYKKEISLSHAIKPNESDRFSIKFNAPLSSRHQFTITLFYNENKTFVIPNILLNYFSPISRAPGMYIHLNPKDLELQK